MKTPIWEQSPGITRATMFNRFGQFVTADLYTIRCIAGPVLRYATNDRDVGYDPGTGLLTWSTKEVRVDDTGTKAVGHWAVGLGVDTWQVPMYPRLTNLDGELTYPDRIGSIPFIEACNGGFLDGAIVTVDRAIFPGWSDPPVLMEKPVGVWNMFYGDAAAIDFGDVGIILNINSLPGRLGVELPNRLFGGPCGHTLFDIGCTLSRAAFVVSGTVGAIVAPNAFSSAIAAPSGSGTYALGRVIMTSGKNAPNSPTPGFGRLVRQWDSGVFTLAAPFYFDLAPGDTFDALPGCDKTEPTCVKFGNKDNFMGQRNIPVPEVAI